MLHWRLKILMLPLNAQFEVSDALRHGENRMRAAKPARP